MSPEDHDIIKSLRALPPNAVYFIDQKEFIVRGYDYYRRERLESYVWRNDASTLTAFVLGTRRYTVEFSTDNGRLTYSCDCPAWTPSSHCKHVVCALLTTINLLSPNTFKIPGHDPTRLQALHMSLLRDQPAALEPQRTGTPKKTDRFEMAISVTDTFPRLSIRKNGIQVVSSWGVPSKLAPFIRYHTHGSSFAREHLSTYLSLHGNAYPIVFETREGEVHLKWDASLEFQSKTQLSVSGDQVDVRMVCLVDGVVREHIHSFWNFVVDLESKKLTLIEDTSGWKMYSFLTKLAELARDSAEDPHGWNRILNDPDSFVPFSDDHQWVGSRLLGKPSFQIPLEQFQTVQINIAGREKDEALRHLILKVNGEPTTIQREDRAPGESNPLYRLTIEPKTEATELGLPGIPSCTLRAECHVRNTRGMPTTSTFSFFPILEQSRDIPVAMKAQKRKTVLYDTFFQLLSVSKTSEADRIIRESLSGNDFSLHAVKSYAKMFLKHFFSAFLDPDARLQFSEGRWALVPNEKAKEALLYLIPFELFGPQVFRGMERPDEMSLPLDLLLTRLPQLHEKLREAGIELTYNHKPVVTSQWNFRFDARRQSGIDWFEIRPEIRCDGVTIDEAMWEQVLHHGGVLEAEGTVRILDANAQEILRSLSAIYQAGNTAKGNRKEIAKIPRLQILDWITLRKFGVQVTLSDEDEALIDRLTRFEKIEKPPLPKRLQGTLRPYQQEGYAWLAFLYQNRFGACLADDMGLGKTIQAISLLGGIKEGNVAASVQTQRPHLVVLPPTLLFNWEQEITRFYPDLRIHFYTGKERRAVFKDCDVVLTTYGLVRRDIHQLEKIPFHVIIFDEAQAIKNIYADTTSAVRRLKGAFKMVMTGTPLENHVGEYYSLIDLCLPGLLGEYDHFKSQLKVDQSPAFETILRRTKPFVLRRTKEKILKELPPKIETDIYLDLTDRQKTLYRQTVARIKPTIEDAYRSKTSAQARIIALTAILKLRQLCLSPRLLDARNNEPSPKIEFLIDRLKELVEEGHSALVFSQFTTYLDLVEEVVQGQGIPFARLDGTTATGKRKKLVQEFQTGTEPSVFLLSLKVGGQGLNLTKASYVFHLDPWWNPAVENQASDRAHRIGQTSTVSIMRILMRHTIEEKMMELKKHKLALYKAVMEDSAPKGTGVSISKSDFDFLLGDASE